MTKKLNRSLLLIIISSILLTGCGFKDIDNRFFIVQMGIDLTEDKENKYRISVKMAVPSLQIDAGKSMTQLLTIDAPTIAEGLRMMKAYVDKELDFGHCNILILGESLVNENVRESIEWMARRRDIQKVATVAIGTPSAEAVINVHPRTERFPGNVLFLHFSEDATESSYTLNMTLSNLMRRLNEKGLDPYLPLITVDEKNQSYIIDKVTLLNKEKSKLTLEPKQTQLLFQLLLDTIEDKMAGAYSSAPYVIAIQDMKTSYKIKQVNDIPTVEMKIRQEISFEQLPEDIKNEYDNEALNQIKTNYSNDITTLLNQIRDAEVDPIGFGLKYRTIKHVNQFDSEWPSIYKEFQFHITTNLDVRGTGLLK